MGPRDASKVVLGIVGGSLFIGLGLVWTFDVAGWGSRRVAAAANSGRGCGFAEHALATRVALGVVLVAIGLGWLLAAVL